MDFLPRLASSSKLWCYLSDTELNAEQVAATQQALAEFVGQWKAHGTQLSADFQILGNQLILIGVDESNQEATGCSIDSQVHFMQELATKLGVDFFNRHLLALAEDNTAKVISFEDLATGMETGSYSDDTLVLDHLLTNLESLRANGVKKLSDSWHTNLV